MGFAWLDPVTRVAVESEGDGWVDLYIGYTTRCPPPISLLRGTVTIGVNLEVVICLEVAVSCLCSLQWG